jgi:hypothetical protein
MSAPLRYVDEVLALIDKTEGDEKAELLKKYGVQHPYNMILSLNFNDNVQLNVPEGVPPYKQDESQHPDTYQTTLAQAIRRVSAIVKGRSEHLPRLQREAIFIQVLEGIPPKEAEVLVFAKDKALTELFPTITYDFVSAHLPQFCIKNEKN